MDNAIFSRDEGKQATVSARAVKGRVEVIVTDEGVGIPAGEIHRVRRLLPQVTCPALVFHAAHDKYVRAEGAQYTYDRIGSADKELVRLAHSGHALTVDVEWETVAERTYAFLRRVCEGR